MEHRDAPVDGGTASWRLHRRRRRHLRPSGGGQVVRSAAVEAIGKVKDDCEL